MTKYSPAAFTALIENPYSTAAYEAVLDAAYPNLPDWKLINRLMAARHAYFTSATKRRRTAVTNAIRDLEHYVKIAVKGGKIVE